MKYLNATNDAMFKAIFLKENNRDLLKRLIEEVIEKKVEIEKADAVELPKNNILSKGKILDILVKSEEGEINIELNNYSNKYLHRRNASYIFNRYATSVTVGKRYSEMKKFMQINLTNDKEYDIEQISCYKLINDKKEEFIDNLEIYEINLAKIKKSWYNGDRKHKLLAGLSAEYDELDIICKGDYIMDKFKNEVSILNHNLDDVEFIDPEVDEKMIVETIKDYAKEQGYNEGKTIGYKEGIKQGKEEGIEQGIEQGAEKEKIEIARKMKEENFKVEEIAKITGLDVEQIKRI